MSNEETPGEAAREAEDSKISSLRVLVADPYAQLREIIRDILLRGLGVDEVIDARSGEEALGLLRELPPDIVIADSVMQPVNGIELTKKIRAGEGGADRFLPVIIISGRAEMGEIIAARDAGANEYLAKPVSAKILELRIHSIIGHPRPFIRSGGFFGPDRRRHAGETYPGSERRIKIPEKLEGK